MSRVLFILSCLEYIGEPSLTPAITHKGRLYRGDTHLAALGSVPKEERAAATFNGENRVYVTHSGKVLNRWKAQEFAVKNDLIDPAAPFYVRTAPELTSEWLRKKGR